MIEKFSTLTFTDAALVQVRSIMIENGAYRAKLRVAVSGGGCTGFEYAFSFVGSANEDDFQMEQGGVPVVVDPTSMQYLSGAEIDCEGADDANNFVINKRTMPASCGSHEAG